MVNPICQFYPKNLSYLGRFFYFYSMRLFTIIALLLFSPGVFGQLLTLEAPIQVCSNATYGGIRPRMTLVHDSIPIIAFGKGGSDAKFFFTRLTAGAFATPIQLNSSGTTATIGSTESVELKSAGDTVFAVGASSYPVWGNPQMNSIMLWRSFDGGVSFSDSTIVHSQSGEYLDFADLTINASGNPVVGFIEQDSWFYHINVYYSTDAGLSFNASTGVLGLIPNETCECCPISLETVGNSVFAGFRNNDMSIREFYLLRSANDGHDFTSVHQIDNSNWFIGGCPSNGIDLLSDSDSIYAAYATKVNGSVRILATSFSADTSGQGPTLTNEPAPPSNTMNYPVITGNSDTLFLCWQDTRNGNTDVFCSYRIGAGNPFSSPVMINHATAGTQSTIDAQYANGYLHLVYNDITNAGVYYRKARLQNNTGINEIRNDNIMLFPNPANDQVTIQTNNNKELINNVLMYNIVGSEAKEIRVNSSQNINISLDGLDAGIYMIEVHTSEGNKIKKTLVVE